MRVGGRTKVSEEGEGDKERENGGERRDEIEMEANESGGKGKRVVNVEERWFKGGTWNVWRMERGRRQEKCERWRGKDMRM